MKNKKQKKFETLIAELFTVEKDMRKLPELPELEKAQLEHSIDMGHLYYSSKLEGTHLTKERINKAIYEPEISAA